MLAVIVPLLASAAPAATTGVSIVNFAYAPPSLHVTAGTTVVWTNNDPAPHSVTSDGGTFDSSPSNCSPSGGAGCIAQGGTFSHPFSTPGTFTYFCVVHAFMHGTIVVSAAATTTTTTRPTTTTSTTRPGSTSSTRPGPTTTTRPGSTTSTSVGTITTVAGTTSIASTTVAVTSTSVASGHSGGSSASPILILLALLVAGGAIFVLYRRRAPR